MQTWDILNLKTDETHELEISNLDDAHEILSVLNKANPNDLFALIEH